MDEINLKKFNMSKIKKDSVCCFIAPRRQGKCLAQGTEIMMHDGSLKFIEDVKEGELVMGDDSTPRKVLNTTSGFDEMYEIENKKGIKYIVNSHHILSLKQAQKKRIRYVERERRNPYYSVTWFDKDTYIHKSKYFYCPSGKDKQKIFESATEFYENIVEDLNVDIPLKDYMNLSKSKQEFFLGYQVPVNFSHKEVEIDPYMIGYWLADGTASSTDITTRDSTVLYYFSQNLPKYDLYLEYRHTYTYKISTGVLDQKNNVFKQFLEKNNLISNKHVPKDYMINSRENRMKLLAGFIDAGGHYTGRDFEITQCSKHLLDDIIFVAKSLGFSAYKYIKKTSWTHDGIKKFGIACRVHINGEGIEEIPTVCPGKRAIPRKQRVSALVSGIKITPKGVGKYYGFELDGNHRFVLGNFIVTHNSVLLKDLLSYHQNIPAGLVISKTDKLTHYYDKFIPPVLIHDEYDPALIDKLLDRQKKALEEKWPNPECFLIFDDTLSEGETWKRDPRIKEIFYNGRHYKILFLLTMQTPMGITPGLRGNIDYTFILRNPNAKNRKDLYEHYCGIFPSREIFEKVLDVTTEDYGCLVIDNTTTSSKLEDNVFYYKAQVDPPPFRLCSNNFWSIGEKPKKEVKNSRNTVLRNNKKLVIRRV